MTTDLTICLVTSGVLAFITLGMVAIIFSVVDTEIKRIAKDEK